jgi:hypothetical protein
MTMGVPYADPAATCPNLVESLLSSRARGTGGGALAAVRFFFCTCARGVRSLATSEPPRGGRGCVSVGTLLLCLLLGRSEHRFGGVTAPDLPYVGVLAKVLSENSAQLLAGPATRFPF